MVAEPLLSEGSLVWQQPSDTVTFLFTDIEGSTRAWEADSARMSAVLARHDALLGAAIERSGGYVFKTMGDAFCAAFTTAPAALEAALEIQRAVQREDWSGPPIRVRIALHTGQAQLRDGDYFGPPLNRVARLLAAGYGGQTLLTRAAHELVRDELPAALALRSLGEHRLRDLLRPEEVFQVVAPDLADAFPPLKSLDRLPHNLPVQISSFIGREAELADVRRMLGESRLVTLTGIGGTGKTRLAQHVAADVLDDFPDGTWFVDLSALTDESRVDDTVARVLGLREASGIPARRMLTDHLGDKRLLLILDNCEHLLAAAASLAGAILVQAPAVRLLATSREALRIAGEHVHPLPSLSVPDLASLGLASVPDPASKGMASAPNLASTSSASAQHLASTSSASAHPFANLAALSQYEAVHLFIERARAVRPDFEVTNPNAPAVAQLCVHLDGIPLAIELAAARVRMMTPEKILERLDQRFRLLTSGSRTAPRRQQTLEAAIDWSHDLLSDAERTVFRRLAVFRGGWTLEAAEAVCSGEGVEEWAVLDHLAGLADKSLVVVEASGVEPRYRFLESLRQYAWEKLTAATDEATTRGAHLAFFGHLLDATSNQIDGPEVGAKLARLEPEHENVRAALEHGIAAGEAEMVMQLGATLWRPWYLRGYLTEGRALLSAALAAPGAEAFPAVQVRVLTGLAVLCNHQGDYQEARGVLARVQAIYTQLEDKVGIAKVLVNLAIAAWGMADLETAHAELTESLVLLRELGDQGGVGKALSNLALVAMTRADYTSAQSLYEESLAISRERADRRDVALILTNLGELARRRKQCAAARTLLGEALDIQRELGDRTVIVAALTNLGHVAMIEGAPAEAAEHFRESLTIAREIGDKAGIHEAIEGIAWMVLGTGDVPRAATLLGASDSLRARHGIPLAPADQPDVEWTAAGARVALGAQAFDAAWDAGQAMTLEEAVACALG